MSMRDQSRSAAAEEGSQIDLTPMLDVVFIMLIFFIVTSSFVKEPGVELFKPQASTQEACERGTIIFAVDANGDGFVDEAEMGAYFKSQLGGGKSGGRLEGKRVTLLVNVWLNWKPGGALLDSPLRPPRPSASAPLSRRLSRL